MGQKIGAGGGGQTNIFFVPIADYEYKLKGAPFQQQIKSQS